MVRLTNHQAVSLRSETTLTRKRGEAVSFPAHEGCLVIRACRYRIRWFDTNEVIQPNLGTAVENAVIMGMGHETTGLLDIVVKNPISNEMTIIWHKHPIVQKIEN